MKFFKTKTWLRSPIKMELNAHLTDFVSILVLEIQMVYVTKWGYL